MYKLNKNILEHFGLLFTGWGSQYNQQLFLLVLNFQDKMLN